MTRRRRTLSVVRGIVVLAAFCRLLDASGPVLGQGLPAGSEVALKERDRLRDQTQKLRAEGKLAEAITAADAVLAIERKVLPADHDDLVGSLGWLAELHVERADFAAARSVRREAHELLRRRYGPGHWKVTDARLALEDLERFAAQTPQQRQKLAEADRLTGEVFSLYQAGKYRDAVTPARRQLALRKEVLGEHHLLYAASLNDLATILRAQDDSAAARPLYESALEIRKAVLGQRHPETADSLNNLGLLLVAQGDRAAAEPLFRQALAIRKDVLGEFHPDTADSLNNLADVFKSRGDYAAARPFYEQALEIRRAAMGEHDPDYADSLNNLALLLEEQGDYAAARPLFDQALKITREVRGERHPNYATILNNLALLLGSQGDYAAARSLYEQALAIRKAGLDERTAGYASSLNNLAALLQSNGEFAAARPLYERALAIRKAVLGERHPDYASSLSNLALLLVAQRDYTAARPLYERALAIGKAEKREHRPDYAKTLDNLALLLVAQGNYSAARPLHEQARAIRKVVLHERHPDYAASLSNMGCLLWAQRHYAEAAPFLNQALEIARGNLDLAAAAQSERQQLAMAQAHRGRLDAYLSIAPLAGLSPEDAYRHLLVSKGAVFDRQRGLRAQRRRLQADPRSAAAGRFAEYEGTVKQLATLALATPDPAHADAWREKLGGLARRKDELEAELARLDAHFQADRAVASRTPEQLRAHLPRGSALVDFFVYTRFEPPAEGKGEFLRDRQVVAFVVRPDRPIARVDLGPIAPIARAIDAWRPALIAPHAPRAAGEAARAVRRLIWEPVEPLVEGTATVLVSPDGPIGLIPLAALPGREPDRFLIEERSIAVVPVPRLLGSAAIAPPPNPGTAPAPGEAAPSLLLVGDIDYGGDRGRGDSRGTSRSAAVGSRAGALPELPRLPATSEEIAAIARYFRSRFPGAAAMEIDRHRATEEALRREAPRHRFVHLATHGYFAPAGLRSALGPDDKQAARAGVDVLGGAGVAGYHPGLLSGIALAGANRRPAPVGQDDGILTALEVAELDLSAVELAILSACETGLGETAGGEGMLGLQRAFQMAGARAVVASLWTVGDEPTRALMARFYENLWREGRPPGEALREAQLYMLREGRRLLREGDKRGLEPLEKGQAADGADRLSPFYWAAFVLSTDRP